MKIIKRKHFRRIVEAIKERMVTLPHAVHTITFDNGTEFARHEEIGIIINAACYFAQPYHSWERGLKEHSNGLVRQYLRKSSNLSNFSHKEKASRSGKRLLIFAIEIPQNDNHVSQNVYIL